MTRSHKTFVYLLVVGAALYGCAKNPAGTGGSERNQSQEAKLHRAEDDFRAAAAARDQYRQKLLAAEEKQTQLQRQLDQERVAASAERDTLKAEIKVRLVERDTVQTQYDGFRKGLKELLAQAESNLNPNPANIPTIPTIPMPPTSPTPSPSAELIGSQAPPITNTGSSLLNN